jgi:biotin-dependent carboxylase uncharacterized domain
MRVRKPGLFTTIQDSGRFGYQSLGVPPSGALDEYSFKIANMLVSNDEDCACLECTLIGPELEFEEDTKFAVAGGKFEVFFNGRKIEERKIEEWRSYDAKTGDVLVVKKAISGCRCYVAFSGGIDVPLIMNSRSTYTKGNIGSVVKGRILLRNKKVTFNKVLNKRYMPSYENKIGLRVVLGPQDDHFTSTGINAFLNEGYKITKSADRMGYRLEGKPIELKSSEIISDGVPLGAVQVPGNGQPIILLKDRQTTGGYPKIATVVTPDIPKVAQAKSGDVIRFKTVSMEEAHSIYTKYYEKFEEIKTSLEEPKGRRFRMIIDGKEYHIEVEEILVMS